MTNDELDSLNRLVVIFLETAEFRAKNRQNLTMDFWKENVDRILTSNDQQLLIGAGSVSNSQMESFVRQVYEDFDARRKKFDAEEADREDLQDLLDLENEIKKR